MTAGFFSWPGSGETTLAEHRADRCLAIKGRGSNGARARRIARWIDATKMLLRIYSSAATPSADIDLPNF